MNSEGDNSVGANDKVDERFSLPWLLFALFTVCLFLVVITRNQRSLWLVGACIVAIGYLAIHILALMTERFSSAPLSPQSEETLENSNTISRDREHTGESPDNYSDNGP